VGAEEPIRACGNERILSLDLIRKGNVHSVRTKRALRKAFDRKNPLFDERRRDVKSRPATIVLRRSPSDGFVRIEGRSRAVAASHFRRKHPVFGASRDYFLSTIHVSMALAPQNALACPKNRTLSAPPFSDGVSLEPFPNENMTAASVSWPVTRCSTKVSSDGMLDRRVYVRYVPETG